MQLQGQRVSILGAARSGIAVAKLLKSVGAVVFVSEILEIEDKKEAAEVLNKEGIDAEFGGHTQRALDKVDFIVVSPGVPMSMPLLKEASHRCIPVYSELEVASWFCKAPIIAITGSNGKTTTTALLGEIFSKAGKERIVAGNIGSPFSDSVTSVTKQGVAIVEVSSFQLEGIKTFKPRVSVLLNITPDHLDRYEGMDQYIRAKKRIFENQDAEDFLIYNADDQRVVELLDEAQSSVQKLPFSIQKKLDAGAYLHGKSLQCRIGDKVEEVIDIGDIRIPGWHNLYNSLAAVLAARSLGVHSDAIAEGLKSFTGVEHRLELVRVVNGVKYINDSKATNVDAVWYALQSYQEPIILIAGGKDKGGDFSQLADLVSEKVKKLILIGQAAPKIESILGRCTEIVKAATLNQAVLQAQAAAQKGDVVLLSPACASFDMFQDFEDRGRQFKEAVGKLCLAR